MKMQTLGNKPQTLRKLVLNTESSVTIKQGAPVVMNAGAAAAKLGYGVKSLEGLAAAEEGFFFGIALADIAAGAYGETVYGFVQYTRAVVRSRAASTDVWASTAALALGDVLFLNTVAGVQAVQRSGAGSAITNSHKMIAADTIASSTTAASSITAGVAGTGLLYSTTLIKTFVQIM